MRIAVCNWKQDSMSNFTGWVPSAEMPRDPGKVWAALDMRPPGEDQIMPAEGLAIVVSKDIDGPFKGALLDLGDDHKAKLPVSVRSRLESLFGVNLAEETPSRILAELFSVHAREDGVGRWRPVVAEQRYRGDKRGRWRIHGGGICLFDEFGGLPDEEVAAWAGYELFPTVNTTFASETWPWTPTRMEVIAGGVARNTAIGGTEPTGGGHARMDFDTGQKNMFTQANVIPTAGGTGQNYGGLSARMNNTTMNLLYYFQGNTLANEAYYWDNTPAYTDIGAGGLTFSSGVQYALRFEINGSSLTSYQDGTASAVITNTSLTTGTRGGIVTYSEAALSNYTYAKVQVGGIFDTPAGGTGRQSSPKLMFQDTWNGAAAAAWSPQWTKSGSLTADVQQSRGHFNTGSVASTYTLCYNTNPLPYESFVVGFTLTVPNTTTNGWFFEVCFGAATTTVTGGHLINCHMMRYSPNVSNLVVPVLWWVDGSGTLTAGQTGSIHGTAASGSLLTCKIFHDPAINNVKTISAIDGSQLLNATVNDYSPAFGSFNGKYFSIGVGNGDTTAEDIYVQNLTVIGPYIDSPVPNGANNTLNTSGSLNLASANNSFFLGA